MKILTGKIWISSFFKTILCRPTENAKKNQLWPKCPVYCRWNCLVSGSVKFY